MDFEKALAGYFIARNADGYSQATLEMYKWALSIMGERLQNKDVGQITELDLQAFFGWVRTEYKPSRFNGSTEPLSGRSLDNIWTAMRSFFNWCESERLVTGRPDKKIKRPKYKTPEVQPFTQEETEKLVKAAGQITTKGSDKRKPFHMLPRTAERNVALVLVLLDTGIRVSECARLHIKDVDTVTGEVTIQPYGTGRKTRPRHVIIGKATRKAVWRYLSTREEPRPGDPLFVTDDDKPFNRLTILQILTRLGKRAGVANVHPHRFRHTFALEYLRNGGDPFTLQRLLGHSSLEMVNHYLQMVTADLEKAHRQSSPVDRWRL
jgi:integrase/recombinase XerD